MDEKWNGQLVERLAEQVNPASHEKDGPTLLHLILANCTLFSFQIPNISIPLDSLLSHFLLCTLPEFVRKLQIRFESTSPQGFF